MRAATTSILVSFLLVASPIARAKDPVVLKPASPWVLNYDEERCALQRMLGEGEETLQFQLESYGNEQSFRITVAGPVLARTGIPYGDIKIRLTPDADMREVSAIMGTVGSLPALSFSVTLAPKFDDRKYSPSQRREQETAKAAHWKSSHQQFEQSTRNLVIATSRSKSVDLQIGDMREPISAMHDCIFDLWESWGLDPNIQKNLSQNVYMTDRTLRGLRNSYPASMLRVQANAFVPVRVMVDANGKATSCVIQSDIVADEFKNVVCAQLSDGFEPALGETGQAVPGVFNTGIYFLSS